MSGDTLQDSIYRRPMDLSLDRNDNLTTTRAGVWAGPCRTSTLRYWLAHNRTGRDRATARGSLVYAGGSTALCRHLTSRDHAAHEHSSMFPPGPHCRGPEAVPFGLRRLRRKGTADDLPESHHLSQLSFCSHTSSNQADPCPRSSHWIEMLLTFGGTVNSTLSCLHPDVPECSGKTGPAGTMPDAEP